MINMIPSGKHPVFENRAKSAFNYEPQQCKAKLFPRSDFRKNANHKHKIRVNKYVIVYNVCTRLSTNYNFLRRMHTCTVFVESMITAELI